MIAARLSQVMAVAGGCLHSALGSYHLSHVSWSLPTLECFAHDYNLGSNLIRNLG